MIRYISTARMWREQDHWRSRGVPLGMPRPGKGFWVLGGNWLIAWGRRRGMETLCRPYVMRLR